ncbi:MAG TPA: hypothetical protein VNT79_12150, partial [Phycisphaerae bacterium]|nr:hypothetical protein [Phycisphaerae bacterium]
IMSPPGSMEDVFRPAQETAGAIERAMHDTAEFAAELFGLERVDPHDSAWFRAHEDPNRDYSSDTQTVEEFLDSPIGIEITARLQLRPMFQGVVDADVVFLNTAVATNMKTLAACAQRIERILEPVNTRLQRRTYFAAGDPLDRRNAGTEGCLKRIADLLSAAKTIHA